MTRIVRSSNWTMLSLKIAIVVVGFIFSGLLLKITVPFVIQFVVLEVPRLWSLLRLLMTPPYLYIVINAIILGIAVSSSFQQKIRHGTDGRGGQKAVDGGTVDLGIPADTSLEELAVSPVYDAQELKAPAPQADIVTAEASSYVDENHEEDFIARSDWSPARRPSEDAVLTPEEKFRVPDERPGVSVRFGHRRSVKASPDGKALGVARPRRQETLECTWKTITEGRPIPLARHLKKSETFETHSRPPLDPATPPFKKSDTMREGRAAAGSPSPGSGRVGLRREHSLSQDDLNRRVEAFIRKFNEEMRLQRQESFKHYMEMVNRGSH